MTTFTPPTSTRRWRWGGRLRAVSGYNVGTSWEEEYLVNGECTDWMYGEQTSHPKILAFLTEVGTGNDGFWPPTSRIAPLVAQKP